MTNQISQTIENWQTMSIAECLSFVDDLVFHASDEEETLAILHELFFQEVNGRGDETLIDALASAISQFMDPATVEELARQVEQTLGVDLSKLSKLARGQRSQAQESDGEPVKRRKRQQQDEEGLDANESAEQSQRATKSKPRKSKEEFVQETLLEFIEEPSGAMILREVGNDEPLVSIAFSDQVKDMLGTDARVVGQAMIHAAIASVVQRQSNFWHAHVYDEEPAHYS
ncbi:hypothetical protein [Moraxella canis]|uniref:hypothetical protein n=1 Tax=Moraxella canis TaxID=90239 RepID=UPI000666FC6E|nr:hypothetical protein [Moraxella canis]